MIRLKNIEKLSSNNYNLANIKERKDVKEMLDEYLKKSAEILFKYKRVIYESDRIEIFLLLADKRKLVETTIPSKKEKYYTYLTCLTELELLYALESDPEYASYEKFININKKMGNKLNLTFEQYCKQKDVYIAKDYKYIQAGLNSSGKGAIYSGYLYGYPPSACDSFEKDKTRCVELYKKYEDVKYLLQEELLLPVDECWSLLEKRFNNELFVWYVHHVRLSKEPEKYEKELEVFDAWCEILKKYQII